MLNVKFKLVESNKRYKYNCEYIANTSSKHPETTFITWVVNGQLHKLSYNTEDVETYFLEGLWIEII